jgi:CheY-like chemotaxis protein
MGRRTEIDRLMELGCSSYLIKPIRQSQLQETLETVMGQRPSGESRSRRMTGQLPRLDEIRPLRVLLAEDNHINQRMIKELLSREGGHAVDIANNGNQAIELWQSKPYDLILMDVQMPEMDGIEAAERIRQKEVELGRRIPIIALTAHAMPGDRQRCLDAGMDDYLSKPLEPRRVFETIRHWCQPDLPGEDLSKQKTVPLPDPNCILSLEHALPRFSGDREFYLVLLKDFIDTLPEKMAEMQAIFAAADLTQLSYHAHNLKGVAANFSAVQLSRLAAELDQQARAGDRDACERALQSLPETVTRLTELVNQLHQIPTGLPPAA